jgi:hypothetical protein
LEARPRSVHGSRRHSITPRIGTVSAVLVALLLAGPVGAGTLHSLTTYLPAYRHSQGQSLIAATSYGCGTAKGARSAWHPTTGIVTISDATSARTCGRTLGPVGGSSFAEQSDGTGITLPFRVSSSGNHSISTQVTVSIASTWRINVSSYSCAKSISFRPPPNSSSYGICEAGTFGSFQLVTEVVDLNDPNWSLFNSSYVDVFNNSDFQNTTLCYHYRTLTCTNTSGYSYVSRTWSLHAGGLSTWNWNGITSFTLWSNSTAMLKGHHYLLMLRFYVVSASFTNKLKVVGPWTGSASSDLNMGGFGNGATITSVTIA